MAIEQFAWFATMGDVGEEVIDLTKCRRFVVSSYDGTMWQDGLNYYFLKDENGDGGRWIRRLITEQMTETNEEYLSDTYRECAPEEVAHQILKNRVYGDRLPKELEDGYREFGDDRRYFDWSERNGGASSLGPGRPRPVWENRCLTFEGKECKQFGRNAHQQIRLIEAIQQFRLEEIRP
jgi:hypothetical protein